VGGFSFEMDTTIDAPIEKVWDYLVHHDEWRRPFIESVAELSDTGPGVGARYENRAKLGPIKQKVINEITEFQPPHRLGWRQVNDDALVVTNRGDYTLEKVGDSATRFVLSVESTTNGVMSIMAPLMPWMAKNVMAPKLLSQLKEGIAKT